jgi:hypothetical protein
VSTFGPGFQKLLEGNTSRSRTPQVDGPQEGIVLDVVGATATFKLSAAPTAPFYGPALFDRGVNPSPGDRCLVVFVGSGIDKPWIVAVCDPA